ncbi:MAG: hypothetical protein IT450_02220 [Phycisphaerales bacterium]|nr:hypothetical protein [Phycisphaerales bacterium]
MRGTRWFVKRIINLIRRLAESEKELRQAAAAISYGQLVTRKAPKLDWARIQQNAINAITGTADIANWLSPNLGPEHARDFQDRSANVMRQLVALGNATTDDRRFEASAFLATSFDSFRDYLEALARRIIEVAEREPPAKARRRKKRGPAPKFPVADDKKLIQAWKDSGLKRHEYERDCPGLKRGDIRRASDRLRSKEERRVKSR